MSATLAPPPRSLQQRMTALDKANVTRTARSEMKKDFKANRKDPLEFLKAPPEWLLTMKTEAFLISIPTVGRVKARMLLRTVGVSPSTTVGGLTVRQRQDVRARLIKRAWR